MPVVVRQAHAREHRLGAFDDEGVAALERLRERFFQQGLEFGGSGQFHSKARFQNAMCD